MEIQLRCSLGISPPFPPVLHIGMLLNASELLNAALNELSPDIRTAVEAHFFDGASIFTIQRQCKAKRQDVEECITTALNEMRVYMRRRGIQGSSDVL